MNFTVENDLIPTTVAELYDANRASRDYGQIIQDLYRIVHKLSDENRKLKLSVNEQQEIIESEVKFLKMIRDKKKGNVNAENLFWPCCQTFLLAFFMHDGQKVSALMINFDFVLQYKTGQKLDNFFEVTEVSSNKCSIFSSFSCNMISFDLLRS